MAYKNKEEIDWAAHAEDVATALLGKPEYVNKGGKEWRFGKKGSLSVDLQKGTFFDHETNESGGIHELIKAKLGLEGPEAVAWLTGKSPDLQIVYTTRESLEKRRKNQEKQWAEERQKKVANARKIWGDAGKIEGTVAQTYLQSREISGDGCARLRFQAECWFGETRKKHPALIGAVTIWPSKEVSGVHRTYLTPEGAKLSEGGVDPKRMLGDVQGGAVRLSEPPEGVVRPLVLCEGIETGLTLVAASDGPVWAALSTSGLKGVKLPPPETAPEIIIAADNDKSRAGFKAAEELAARLEKAGYGVAIAMPKTVGQDFNDLHQEAGIEAVKRVIASANRFAAPEFPRLLNGENWPFEVNEKGVFHIAATENRDGEKMVDHRFLCTPIHVEAETVSSDGTGWGRRVCVIDRAGNKHRVILTAADIAEGARSGVFQTLASLGATIKNSKALRDRLLEYLDEAKPESRVICAERIGWDEVTAAFVLPDASYGGDAASPVVYAPRSGDTGNHPYQVKGTLEDWIENVAEPCRGNSRLIFSLCVACAGPLLRLVDGEGGIFHFSGPSSIGKSTTLAVAGSFWGGGGLHGFRDTWRATDNALENKALAHSDALICLDELGQADAHAAQKATYMLAQGTGKARMAKAGGSQTMLEWRINGLSSGEIGMSEKLAEGRSKFTLKDGQEARFVEIPADAGADMGLFEALGKMETPAALADHFREATAEYYGAPCRKLLEVLAENRVKLEGQARKGVREFRALLAQQGAVAAVDRVAARFAIAATAGALAAKYGILPFEAADIRQAVSTCFRAWLRVRGGTGSREAFEATARVASFVGQFAQSRFQDWEYNSFQNVQKRAGFRKPAREGGLDAYSFYLLPAVLKDDVLEGLNHKVCIAGMADAGFIVTHDGKVSASLWVPSEGRSIRLIQLSEEILDFGAD